MTGRPISRPLPVRVASAIAAAPVQASHGIWSGPIWPPRAERAGHDLASYDAFAVWHPAPADQRAGGRRLDCR